MRRYGWLAVPALLAALPGLRTATFNMADVPPPDALVEIALRLLLGAAIAGAVGLALRRRYPTAVATIAACCLVALLFIVGFAALQLHAAHPTLVPRARWLTAGGALALLALALWAMRHPRAPAVAAIARGVSVFVPALSAIVAGQLVLGWMRRPAADAATPGARALRAPIPRRADAASPAVGDVYVVVLDRYANADVLRSRFGFDNAAFEDSLRALGFTIPARTRSNYPSTVFSLSSFLSASYVEALDSLAGPDPRRLAPYYDLISNGRVLRFLQARGYRVYDVPSVMFTPTRTMRVGEEAPLDPRFHRWVRAREALERIFLASLPAELGLADRLTTVTQELTVLQARATLDAVALPGPKVVFAHLMITHPPFFVDAHCAPLPKVVYHWDVAAYLAGVRCTNRLLLQLARAALARGGPPPVIILQGDHGTQTLFESSFGAGDVPLSEIEEERLGAFGAYFLPGGDEELARLATPVGVMRGVLRRYFGADLPSIPDAFYGDVPGAPRLVRVDSLLSTG